MSYPDTAEHKYKQEIRNIYIKILLKDQWSFAFKWLGKNSLSPLSPIIKINKDMPVATNITDTEASSDGQRWKADIWNDSRQIMSAIVPCILFSCVNPLWLSVITSCQCFTKWQYNLYICLSDRSLTSYYSPTFTDTKYSKLLYQNIASNHDSPYFSDYQKLLGFLSVSCKRVGSVLLNIMNSRRIVARY